MRRLFVSIILLFAGMSAFAQSEMRIGFVNAERIMRESAPAVRAQKKLEKEFEKRAQELKRLEQQVHSLQSQFDRSRLSLSDSDRLTKERELGDARLDFQRKSREFREDQTTRTNEELAGVLDRANKTIRQVAEAERFDLIVQEAVYFNPRIDITDKVLKALADPQGK